MDTPLALHLVVDDPDAAAAWYAEALGAVETRRLDLPDGTTVIVDLDLAGTPLALAGPMPDRGLRTPADLGATSAAFHLGVDDAVAAFERAVAAGATVWEPLADAFWGERTGQVLDPSGHRWTFAQHLRDVPDEEVAARLAVAFGQA